MPRPTLALAGFCVLGSILAFHFRFVQDDAFIAFSYARSLVEGHGLTWFGQRVEGYTDFLWVVWIALGQRLGIAATHWSFVGGIACFVAVIAATWALCHRIFAERVTGCIALALLLGNYSVLSYATGGLETMAQTALLCAAMWQTFVVHDAMRTPVRRLWLLSLLLALAILTRPDSALPCGVMFAIVLWELAQQRAAWRQYASLCLPALVIVGTWGLWKLSYYGSLLPNSYAAKVAHEYNPNGLHYVWRFLHWYLLWPVLAIGLLARLTVRRVRRFWLWPLWVTICSWALYVVYVGGDFMEFRLFVPIAPFLFIVLAYLVRYAAALLPRGLRHAATAVPVVLLIAASVHHGRTFKATTADDTLDSIAMLSTFYGLYPDGDWSTLGTALREQLGDAGVTVGLFAVGAIPFYSRLTTVDMYGLNDRDVAADGDALDRNSWRPGHRVQASLRQLQDKNVHLVIGHPRLVPLQALNQRDTVPMCHSFIRAMMSPRTQTVNSTAVVLMPLSPRHGLLMWYLTPHPRVDALVESGQWTGVRLPQVRFSP